MNSDSKDLMLSPQAIQALKNGKRLVRNKLIQILQEQKTPPLKDNTKEITNKILKSNKQAVKENSNTKLNIIPFPSSIEDRERIHWGLCSYVFNNDGHRGLTGFMKKVTNNDDLQKILRWLEIYSTVEIENQVNGSYLFRKKKNSDTFSPKLGREKPYYEMDLMSRADRFKALTLLPPSTKGATQKSNKDFQKKVLKSCLDDFLTSPSLENQKRLNNLIESYINSPSTKGGRITVSGGLPGLGKRR